MPRVTKTKFTLLIDDYCTHSSTRQRSHGRTGNLGLGKERVENETGQRYKLQSQAKTDKEKGNVGRSSTKGGRSRKMARTDRQYRGKFEKSKSAHAAGVHLEVLPPRRLHPVRSSRGLFAVFFFFRW